jgi:hypothetical protein
MIAVKIKQASKNDEKSKARADRPRTRAGELSPVYGPSLLLLHVFPQPCLPCRPRAEQPRTVRPRAPRVSRPRAPASRSLLDTRPAGAYRPRARVTWSGSDGLGCIVQLYGGRVAGPLLFYRGGSVPPLLVRVLAQPPSLSSNQPPVSGKRS